MTIEEKRERSEEMEHILGLEARIRSLHGTNDAHDVWELFRREIGNGIGSPDTQVRLLREILTEIPVRGTLEEAHREAWAMLRGTRFCTWRRDFGLRLFHLTIRLILSHFGIALG